MKNQASDLSILTDLCTALAKAERVEVLVDVFEKCIHQLWHGVFFSLYFSEENAYQFVLSNTDRMYQLKEDDAWEMFKNIEQRLVADLKTDNFRQNVFYKDAELWQKFEITETLVLKLLEVKAVLLVHTTELRIFDIQQLNVLRVATNLLVKSINEHCYLQKIAQLGTELQSYPQKMWINTEPEQGFTQIAPNVIGTSPAIQEVFQQINQVAKTDSTILLLGESGTGKEVIAKTIHESSERKNKTMIKVNCATIPTHLLESEFFGHEKGSFTGASQRRIGKFEQANGSTIFLDEIGELPIELQMKLLRVLQEREFERIGGYSTIKVNVRIIAATNKNLAKEVNEGRFRLDLYYRLNVFPIELPALRERKEDIPLLVDFFIQKYAKGKNIKTISSKALEQLILHTWPGNIRELEHLIERSVLTAKGDTIREVKISTLYTQDHEDFALQTLADIEREHILKVLKICNGKIFGQHGAAIRLGLPPTTLISKMQKLGITKKIA